MSTQLRAVSLCVVSLLALASGLEFHAEHGAVHQTALQRRSKSARIVGKGTSVEDERYISTPLVDEGPEYIGTVGVGTNAEGKPQFVAQVVFDTGSTNLWIASTLCKEANGCDNSESYYDPMKSLTQEAYTKVSNTTEIDVHFGTGELIGPLHLDTFRVGPMVVKKQPFAMIREMASVLSALNLEGIAGLGFPSMSTHGITPFFDHVIEQKLLQHNEFAFFMHRDSNKPSALLWGGIDKDLYDGPIRMFPVIQAHYWSLELVDLKVGNISIPNAPKKLIVDTGTTEFTAPGHVISQLIDKVRDTNGAPLTYVLRDSSGNTYDLQVPKEVYLKGRNLAFHNLNVPAKYGPGMLLGEIFMRHYFTVFDRGDGSDSSAKVGFALAKVGVDPKVKWPLKAAAEDSKTTPVFLDMPDQKKRQPGLMRSEPEIQVHQAK